MPLLILSLIIPAFLISFLSTLAIKHLAPRIGFTDKPGHRKIHHNPKPLGGGVAIFLGLVLPMAAGLIYVNVEPPQMYGIRADGQIKGLGDHPGAEHWPGVRRQTPLALKFILAITAIHLLGLFDDRKPLGPFIKLLIQLSITLALILAADLRALSHLDHLGLGKWPSVIITLLWITAITNAFNFLDNMDGLSAGVAAVCALAFLTTTLLIGQWFVAAVLALLLGALIGFLCFNFHPASIFMGDSGSLLIGLVLGVLTIRTTYLPPGADLGAGWYAVLAPLIVLAVPLYDLIVVSFIRISRGRSPFVGDTNHFSHRLVARGMSRRTAVLTIWLITSATSIAAILLPHTRTPRDASLLFLQTLLILSVVMLLEQHPLPGQQDDPPNSS